MVPIPTVSSPWSRLLDIDTAPKRIGLLIALAALVAAVILAVFPLSFVLGTHPFWQYQTGDLAQHLGGAAYFTVDRWRWPLFFVPDLGIPAGTNIVFTDSIPLLALASRLVFQVTGTYYPYFGLWLFFCFVLQGPAFAFALSCLGLRHGPALLLAGLLAVLTPALLFRIGHMALCGHFLILLALAVHFHVLRTGDHWRSLYGYLPLLVASLLVHLYLFAMVLCVLAMTVLHGLWTGRLSAAGAFAQAAVAGAVLVPVMLASGLLGAAPLKPEPFGEYALNLASPVVPQRSGLFPGAADRVLGNGESFNYAGAGALLLLASALLVWRRALGRVLAEQVGTVTVAVSLVLFAASYAVHVGPVLVLGIPTEPVREVALRVMSGTGSPFDLIGRLSALDLLRIALYGAAVLGLAAWLVRHAVRARKKPFLIFLGGAAAAVLATGAVAPFKAVLLLSNFQASARFYWVVGYLLLASAVAGLARRLRPGRLALLLAGALVLQAIDTRPLQDHLLTLPERDARALVPDHAVLEAAFAGASRAILVPTYLCTFIEVTEPVLRNRIVARVQALQHLASRSFTPINSVHNSRMTSAYRDADTPDCTAEREAAIARRWGEGAVYLLLTDETAFPGLARRLASDPGCMRLTDAFLCR